MISKGAINANYFCMIFYRYCMYLKQPPFIPPYENTILHIGYPSDNVHQQPKTLFWVFHHSTRLPVKVQVHSRPINR